MPQPVYLLGISAYYHDSAACLLKDGEIVCAAQEERFSRKKHDPGFPARAARACLDAAGIPVERVDAVGFYDKPILKFDRLLETHLARAPLGMPAFLMAMPQWLKGKVRVREAVRKALGYSGPVLFSEHHLSHAASAFYPSPFNEAAILTVDGVGEWATTTIGAGRGSEIQLLSEQRFPHSLGLLYSAFTSYTGFKVNSGEYKLMGLAPYGEPRYVETILRELVDLKPDGSFRIDGRYFDYAGGLRMTSRRFHRLFGGPPRAPESAISEREMDLARSIQAVTEEVLLRLARTAHEMTGLENLCLAGGVALNCVANGRILREGPFRDIWIQPAAGDAGGALGVAQALWHRYLGRPRPDPQGRDAMRGALLGPSHSDREIARFLERAGAEGSRLPEEELLPEVAERIAAGEVVGWFQGPMEFGPRALGGRSILGDPRNPRMQSQMNLKIKFRESFRPFAPAVLRERAAEYFELDRPSPYMLLVAPVRRERWTAGSPQERPLRGIERLNVPRSDLPAVTHLDHSARVQTVDEGDHPRFHRLLAEFERQTGCAVLINTSFNVRGEPMVATPEEAYRCFLRTGMDCLVLGSYLLQKARQKPLVESRDWRKEFVLD
jgi:carbamoyltransferase